MGDTGTAAEPSQTSREGERTRGGDEERGGSLSDRREVPLRVEEEEEEDAPKNNLWLVMPAIGLVGFISALDQSIVATALPTIAEEFNTTPSEYSWIGTSYLLSQTIMNPVNGRLTDIIGRKPALYASVGTLLVFSALCGAAKNATWLIVARAFAGIGGGSLVSLTLIVISDIVPLEQRGAYQGYMGASWGIAGTLGPILGGVLTAKASWRWCFYINIPTCGIALLLLVFFLKLKRVPREDVAALRSSYDFLGLGLVMAGAALLIVGFSSAADDGFGAKSAYGVIVAGGVVMVVAVVHCLTTKRNAIIPARLLKTRTPLFFVLGSFFQSLMFVPSQFLLPQFFQGVQGASSLRSGVDMIPYSASLAVCGVLAGQITSRFHIVRPVIWAGFLITSIGYGVWYAELTSTVKYSTQEGILSMTAAGIGLAISTPMLVIQAAMPAQDMAASTSAWVLMRSLGACVGVAVFTAIFNTGLRSRFSKIDGYGTVFTTPTSREGYVALHDLPLGETRTQVLAAFADSIRTCWIIGCGLVTFALCLTLWTKSYSLQRGTPDRRPSDVAVQAVDGDLEQTDEKGADSTAESPIRPTTSRQPTGQIINLTRINTATGDALLVNDGLREALVPITSRSRSRQHHSS